MNIYDAAAHKFYSTLKIKSLPISSWDLYAPFFDSTCKNYIDVDLLTHLAVSKEWDFNDKRFNQELFEKRNVIVVTDPQLTIIYATQNIIAMNGYSPKEIVGKNPKMFQGANTCRETSNVIRMAVKNKEAFEATIINYKKDGTAYKCWIKGEPIFNTSGEVINFIAYEKEVA